jgi:hypothetical protein
MKDFEKQISSLIANQFPSLYAEEGPFLIEFLKAYYEWMELVGKPVYESRTLLNYRDVDETVDEFLIHFKKKFLADIQFETTTNKRLFIKNALDFYRSKGTERSVELLFKLVYGEDPEVYFPSEDIFRLSDNEWVKPTYLEVTPSPYNALFINEQIVGVTSGATAFVERYVRKRVGTKYVEVLYISVPTGDFETGEILRLSDGSVVENLPVVVGSTTTLDVVGGSLGFAVGDIVSFESETGLQGKARVAEISDVTGVVDFNLVESGFGYFANSPVVVSTKSLNLTNTSNTNFVLFETVTQPKANVQFDTLIGSFVANDDVYFYYSDDSSAGVGKVLEQSNTELYISLISGGIKTSLSTVNAAISTNTITVKAQSNAVTANVTAFINKTSTANLMGVATNNGVIGLTTIFGTFVSLPGNYIELSNSGITANVTSVSTGTGATFQIANLNNQESIWFWTDRISSKNNGNVYFYDLRLDGSNANNAGSTYGFPKFLDANTSTVLYTALNIASGNIGGVSSIKAENPGTDYNVDPFVLILEDDIYGFDKRDYVIDFTYNTGSVEFIVGEKISQVLTIPNSVTLTVTQAGAGINFGDYIFQSDGVSNVATGIVQSYSIVSNTGTIVVNSVSGTFDPAYDITFLSTSNTANVSSVNATAVSTTASGVIKSIINANAMTVKRISFANSFSNTGGAIIGAATAASANIVLATPQTNALPIGINAVVSANVQAGAGAITELEVVDSGFGYVQDDIISGTSEDGLRTVSLKINLGKQGISEGYYNSMKSFASADKYVQDGEYYQEYSYEILSRLPFNKYADVLRKALHVAGTRSFGSVVMASNNQATITASSNIVSEVG